MRGATLDSGALIALEHGSTRMQALVERALSLRLPLAVPAGVVAQTWHDGARQTRIARLLRAPIVEVVALDELTARAVGVACRRANASDVVDVSVVLCARERGHAVVTSDPDHLRAIDPAVPVAPV